ncbi:hypothetical protein [Gordonia sp. NB41Y]|uniref:hypothetical protein n=1 Tax=Gordonia sp. NB41Y TaxID=875808 RepID=UPI0006B1F45B|nr:hypothetical protein [Gordonia sp. NB41Y]EMP14796.2 hypothetical protein ISGA_2924 [Gordonia sp. NB41Y]WLP92098.1 hypothetical protein Q9K23_07650 [Gordonia sp. NB41Y]
MTKSSVKKLGLTRRVVASSGIAAALFAASPVAVALADDGGAGSGTSVEKTDDGTDSVDVEDDSGSGGPESADSGASGSGTGDAGASDGGTSEAGAEGSPASTGVPGDSTADDTGETETAVAEPVSGDPSEPGATGPEPSTTTSVPTQGAPVTGSQLGSPVVADSDAHDAPTTPPRHRLPGGRHTATPAPAAAGQPRTGQGAGTVAGGSELIEIPVGAIESPEEPEGLIGKLFYRLTGGSGTEGLILVNQAAVVAGVLNRRSRHDGSDYLGLVGPGEKQFIPKATIAELVLGRHAPKSDLESFDLTASSVPNALARSLIAVAAQVAPDDRFWQTDDPATTGYWPADGVGIHDENVYYTVDDGAIVVHNDSDHDIAVSVYSTADGSTLQFDEIVVIGAGQTHSSSATDDRSRVIVVQAPKETTGPNAGKAQIYGAILRVAPSAGSPGYVLPYDAYFGDGVPGLSDPVWGPLDPDDHFWSPNEALTAAVAGDNHGVHYGYSAEDGTITFTNDSDETVAVVAYDAFLQPVGPGMAILAPGQSATLQVPPTGQVAYMVQQERDASGAIRIIGALTSVDGQVSPASGQYPLKTDAEYALDPDDRFWDVKEGTSSVSNGVLPSTMVGANGVAEGIYYTRDGDIVTIHNDSDHDIAVSWMAYDHSHSEFVVIAPGGNLRRPGRRFRGHRLRRGPRSQGHDRHPCRCSGRLRCHRPFARHGAVTRSDRRGRESRTDPGGLAWCRPGRPVLDAGGLRRDQARREQHDDPAFRRSHHADRSRGGLCPRRCRSGRDHQQRNRTDQRDRVRLHASARRLPPDRGRR